MKKYLNRGIKDIISLFPKVAEILDEYNIGCAPCSVGSCFLKDILSIHNLPKQKELELMYRIEKAIYPDRDVKIPEAKEMHEPAVANEIKYSPPMKKLADEHVLIKRLIALIPEIVKTLDIEKDWGRNLVLNGVDFIRQYADKFHHAKEEDILFKYFDENLDIIKAMLTDHDTARNHVKAILSALEKKDKTRVIEHLVAYSELLTEHIKKENEILYPWLDRNLSITQIGELFSKFNDADTAVGKEVPEIHERFVEKLEKELQNTKREVIR